MKGKLLRFVSVAVVLILATLSACGGDDSSTASLETGIVMIGVTDKPDEDITAIKVTTNLIEATLASDTQNEGEWEVLVDTEKTFDLIQVAGVEEILGETELPEGTYNQIRMHVTSVTVTINGEEKEADVPSDTIKLVRPLEVKAGETVVATFDFDASESVVVTGADNIIFKPVVKMLVRNSDDPFVPQNGGSSGNQDTGSDDTSTSGNQGNSNESGSGAQLPAMAQGDEQGFFLNITSPEQSEVIVSTDTITVSGQTSVDAAVSIGEEFVDIDIDGNFSSNISLEDGVNIIEVVASIASGEQYDEVITVIFVPEE